MTLSGQNAVGDISFNKAVLLVSGADSEEELDESLMERYLSLSQRPLRLNRMSRSALISSGLFSLFQVASFLDYRQRQGDVLSFT
ncbi:MAG: hypothetical protein MJY67_08405, partial [Bacteroidales bacterium]|nr:hypothetical protein [Bacteroidales bacterium]